MQKQQDKLGYDLRIKRTLLNIDHSRELSEKNRETLYLFQKKIATNLSTSNKIRSLGQQQKLLTDAFILGKRLGETSFESLLASEKDFRLFETKIREIGDWKQNTKNQRLMSLKQVLKVCFNPPEWLNKIQTGKVGHTKPLEHEIISPEEMLRIIEVAPNPKERAIFALLREGLRPAEFLRLNYENINFDTDGRAQIQITEGKTGMGMVPTRRGAIYLRQWIDVHPLKKVGTPLFPTAHGTRLSYEQLNILNLRVMERAGINPARSRRLYNWRKSSITNFLRANGKPREACVRYRTSMEQIEKSYDQISAKDINESADIEAGITPTSKREPLKDLPIDCVRCGAQNESFKKVCTACGWNLEIKNPVMEMEKRMQMMHEEMRIMSELVKRKIDPEKEKISVEVIKEIIRN